MSGTPIVADDGGLSLLAAHSSIGIDSNVFVYLFESSGSMGRAAAVAVDALSGRKPVFASIGLLEVLGGPARVDDRALMERYVDEIRSIDGMRIVDLDADIAFAAASERARTGMTLGDAIHVASARLAGATAFLTNDTRIRPAFGLDVIPLSAFVD
jgi:predicted nucleic acid-binding protein